MLMRVLIVFLTLKLCVTIDTITPTSPLKEGDILLSKSGRFTLGFFNPANSTNRYVGLWFTKVSDQTIVWVANRETPINGSNGTLSINEDGHLKLTSGETSIWSTSSVSSNNINSTSCQLLDSGNLVLSTNYGKTLLWQSFDHLTDTYLPGMKLGLDRKAGVDRYLTSWRSKDDPSPGKLTLRVDPNGSPQFFLYQGSDPVWRTGPWIGQRWSGVPFMSSDYYVNNYSFVSNGNEVYITYNNLNDPIISIIKLDGVSGRVKVQNWQDKSRRWIEVFSAPEELCDQYGECGGFGNCNPNSGTLFQCTCFPGYQPKSPRDWYLRDGSQGCVRVRNESMCKNGEGFLKITGVKLPDTSKAMVTMSLAMKECNEECLKNCSCVGYTIVSHDSSGGSDCVLYGQLMDTRIYSSGGQDVYLRLDANELAKYQKSKGLLANKKLKAVFILLTAISTSLIIFLVYWVHKKKKREWEEEDETALWIKDAEENDASSDSPFYTRSEIAAATNNFNLANKLGEGGFGSVYKGRLGNGQEIAVKKLAPNSGQGIQEFKNEVRLIAKLQHRNLVKMLGCCIRGEEKMLIYEFMPNKSLDTFIFKEENKSCLDWRKRFDIILGIARGMLYLHQDSRLRIIHRDLKASNILLDNGMVPKISDFGTARIFGNEQVQVNTNRVVGTYGYMAPEYALQGLMSVKSDVFSFGVLLLEIVTGRKNSGFYPDNPTISLVGHVWELWQQERSLEIIDPYMIDADIEELLICIQVGLLCVQECADDRPTMSAVVFLLSNKVDRPSPKQPAFIPKGNHHDADPSFSSVGAYSVNEVSITTMVDGR